MMIQDKDLEFLQYCTNPDLFDLCDIITTYGNYQFRGKYDLTNEYKRCDATYLRDICRDIAVELRRFGGSTFFNLVHHGQAPSYEFIVRDVCKKMKVRDWENGICTEELEHKLLCHMMGKEVKSPADVEKKQLKQQINKKLTEEYTSSKHGLTTIFSLVKPKYRVTVPAVLQVAYMRMKYNTMYEKYASKRL